MSKVQPKSEDPAPNCEVFSGSTPSRPRTNADLSDLPCSWAAIEKPPHVQRTHGGWEAQDRLTRISNPRGGTCPGGGSVHLSRCAGSELSFRPGCGSIGCPTPTNAPWRQATSGMRRRRLVRRESEFTRIRTIPLLLSGPVPSEPTPAAFHPVSERDHASRFQRIATIDPSCSSRATDSPWSAAPHAVAAVEALVAGAAPHGDRPAHVAGRRIARALHGDREG